MTFQDTWVTCQCLQFLKRSKHKNPKKGLTLIRAEFVPLVILFATWGKNMITLTSYSSTYNELVTDYNSACNMPRQVTAKYPAMCFYFHHEFLVMLWVFNFRHELFFFAVRFSFLLWAFLFCSELFSFAVSFSLLQWAFLFCCELFFFAVALVGHRISQIDTCSTSNKCIPWLALFILGIWQAFPWEK